MTFLIGLREDYELDFEKNHFTQKINKEVHPWNFALVAERNHDVAHALLQNFRQKLCFRTEDPVTLDFMEKMVGKARVKKIANSQGNQHHSKTITESREGVLDAQLFRELQPRQAVAMLSLSGHSMDDVMILRPVY